MGKIPVIDLSDILDFTEKTPKEEEDAFNRVYPALCDAMKTYGFAYLVNHGVDFDIVDALNATSRKFFELPLEVKMKHRKIFVRENFVLENLHGFSQGRLTDVEGTKMNLYEAFDYTGLSAHDEANYPTEVPGYKAAVDNLRLTTNGLLKKLLRCLALGLGLEDTNYFIKCHQRALGDKGQSSLCSIRNNFFPTLSIPIPSNKEYIRMGEHKDWCSISLVFQDSVGGLEAEIRTGEWMRITPKSGSIVLNLGVMMEVWSGGHYRATTHRVRLLSSTSTLLRQSCGVFLQGDEETPSVPIVSKKENWKPHYPYTENETTLEYLHKIAAQEFNIPQIKKVGE